MNPRGETSETGIIAWFASNHVAANLLMLLIVAFGIVSSFTIRNRFVCLISVPLHRKWRRVS